MNALEKLESGKKLSIQDIASIAKEDKSMALAVAKEKQVLSLIDKGIFYEDDYTRWDNLQEELRCELNYL